MKTRICPLCDQPMKKKHHCDSCNSFIWKPMYLDIHYNTGNQYEADCSYDSKPHDYKYYEDGSVTMMPSGNSSKREDRKFRGVEEIDFTTRERQSEKRTAIPKQKKGGCLKKFVLIFFILSMITTITEIVFTMISDVSQDFVVPEPDFSNDDVWDEEFDNSDVNEIEYTVDEVIALGEECTGYDHMSFQWSDVAYEIESRTVGVENGHTIEYSESTYNWAYDYGSFAETYFTSSRVYTLGEDIGFYEIGWDTYSGNVHYIDFDVCGRDMSEYYFSHTMAAVKLESDRMLSEFQRQLDVAEEDGYVFYDIEGLEVYISYYDEESCDTPSYYISITKSMYE